MMEKFFRAFVAVASFMLVVAFCMSGDIKTQSQTRKISQPSLEKAANFEQIPAIVNLGEENEKKFNRPYSEKRRRAAGQTGKN